MKNLFVAKLERFCIVSESDRHFLHQITSHARNVEPDTPLAIDRNGHLLLNGFACISKTLQSGRRQITSYLIPGDFWNLGAYRFDNDGHEIVSISPCTVVDFSRRSRDEMMQRPAIAEGLWRAVLAEQRVLREWIVNIGQRNSTERIAHFFCEIHYRMELVGLAHRARFKLPITQVELAESMGLSPVHVNRALQTLRTKQLIELRNGELNILDLVGLQSLGHFDAFYLDPKARQTLLEISHHSPI